MDLCNAFLAVLFSVPQYDGDRLLLRLLVLVSTGDAVIQTSSDAGSQPAWRRRWAVGAFGARPDTYTLRRIEVALVLHNGFFHSHKRQWYGRMQSTSRREKKEDGSRETKTQWSETTEKQTPQQQQGLAQAAEGMIRNKIFSLLLSLFSRCSFFPRSLFATVTSICA